MVSDEVQTVKRIVTENMTGTISSLLSPISFPSIITRKTDSVRPKVAGNEDVNLTVIEFDLYILKASTPKKNE